MAAVLAVAVTAALGLCGATAGGASTIAGLGAGQLVTRSFGYTGTIQKLDLPPGVTSIQVTAVGGSGSRGSDSSGGGGQGTRVHTVISLDGSVASLQVLVGGSGGSRGGWNGGGRGLWGGGSGGGASEVRLTEAIGSRLVVAGGGGGAGNGYFRDCPGGSGGSLAAGSLDGGNAGPCSRGVCIAEGAKGGTLQHGGAGGIVPCFRSNDGTPGTLLQGGTTADDFSEFGGGGGGGGYYGGGGGGMGYYGAGGSGGGAGSSFAVPRATDVSYSSGPTAGVEITYFDPSDPSLMSCSSPVTARASQTLTNVQVCTLAGPPEFFRAYPVGPGLPGLSFTLSEGPPEARVVLNGQVTGPPGDYTWKLVAVYPDGRVASAYVTVAVT